MNPQHAVNALLEFIDASPTPWHVVESIEKQLLAAQFSQLEETDKWNLVAGGHYYVIRDDSSLVAFVVGSVALADSGYKIIGTHTDSPGLRLKPNAISNDAELFRLAVEIYGGPILATFTDRDLSLAGRVLYKTNAGKIASQLLKFDMPLLRLPNLAIHLNRAVNEDGLKLHKQNELPLILAQATQQLPQDYFQTLLTQTSGLTKEQILSWELSVYDTQKGVIWGAEQEFYADSQLDNLASCHASLAALLHEDSLKSTKTVVCSFFDHEEVGSESLKGAASSFLPSVLKRIALATATAEEGYEQALARSFMLSVDMAHAYQPSFPSAYDSQHKVLLNHGVVIKTNANQRYSSNAVSIARFIDCCKQANMPYQWYAHRCDLPCGSTIGPIVAAKLGIQTVDIGSPLWAMHSLRESAGVLDHAYLMAVLRHFFAND